MRVSKYEMRYTAELMINDRLEAIICVQTTPAKSKVIILQHELQAIGGKVHINIFLEKSNCAHMK